MTYEQFKRQVQLARLNIRSFAELLKVNPNSITNYARKKSVPKLIGIIAVLMADIRLNDEDVDFKSKLSKVSIKPRKSHGGGENAFGRKQFRDQSDV